MGQVNAFEGNSIWRIGPHGEGYVAEPLPNRHPTPNGLDIPVFGRCPPFVLNYLEDDSAVSVCEARIYPKKGPGPPRVEELKAHPHYRYV